MNFEKVLRKNRKAISPVLATVILIAITLIAAVAIAGFVFGLFGTFTKTAQVSLGAASCTDGVLGFRTACTLSWTNTGNANTATAGTCSISYGGTTLQGAISAGGGTLASGASGSLTCTANAGAGNPAMVAGESASGAVSLTNGGSALFSGSG